MTLVCGIDEAGRGPCIGPLVMCGVVIDEKDEIKLASIGTKDSKLLTPRTREILFDQIIGMVKDYKVIIIQPKEIDSALLSETLNLNWLEAVKAAEIINHLKADKVIIDCPSNNPKAYSAYLKNHVENKKTEIIAEHKADFKFTVVAAASIIAKVTRDREIKKIQKEIGIDFGSGYPSDEITVKFLKENYNKYQDIFRKTWQTYKNVASEKKQKRLGEF